MPTVSTLSGSQRRLVERYTRRSYRAVLQLASPEQSVELDRVLALTEESRSPNPGVALGHAALRTHGVRRSRPLGLFRSTLDVSRYREQSSGARRVRRAWSWPRGLMVR